MRRLAFILLATALCCSAPQRTPGETTLRYLEALASDPIRTLELLTSDFHDAHGLRFEAVAERPFADPQARATASDDVALELERARMGWLSVLTKRIFALQGPRFEKWIVSEEIRGDAAEVVVRVEGAGLPPLDARFRLRRADAAAAWRIDVVWLPEIADAQRVQAFLIAPDAALHRRIAEARSQRRSE